jgi:Putative F0F1-ATPase subunit Ca2+/Mg2+ transporter
VDLNDKRALYNGFGDTLAKGVEFALTPAIFGFLGYLLDRAVGTLPVFLILFTIVCVVGMFIRSWYAYDAQMKEHEAAAPWGRAKSISTGSMTAGGRATPGGPQGS